MKTAINQERLPLEYYLNLKYPVSLYPEKEGGYTVLIKDLPGCMSQGETVEEAMEMIEDARRLWLEVAYEHGDTIPLPETEKEYSGRFVVRLPKSIHRHLAERAEQEDTSLNQYVVSILSKEVGYRAACDNAAIVINHTMDGYNKLVSDHVAAVNKIVSDTLEEKITAQINLEVFPSKLGSPRYP